MVNPEEIIKNIKIWVSTNLQNFEFRPHQLETIYSIINNIVNKNTETTIIEAPTGSGKSLLCLISAGVLYDFYKLQSYILCSDLYLWQQYADFIKAKKLPFGMLKGSKGNYICDMNGQDISLGFCKLKNTSYRVLMDYNAAAQAGFECAHTCEYIRERKRAINSKVTLMTYQLWLHYVNLTDGEIFGQRNVIFCDECHNIPNIIQMFCQPNIYPKTHFMSLESIMEYAIDNAFSIPRTQYLNHPEGAEECELIPVSKHFSIPLIHKDLSETFDAMYNTDDKAIILDNYSSFYRIIEPIAECAKSISTTLKNKLKNGKDVSKAEMKLLKASEWVLEYKETMFNFMKAVSLCGENCLDYLVKNNGIDQEQNRSITFTCAKEDVLCNKYMLQNSPYKVMLSATVGAHDAFDENIGIKLTNSKESEMMRIPSTFDFTKSPIYYLPKYKMSKYYIEQNFQPMQQLIMQIISSARHNNEKGIIHTGSYKNALRLFQMMPDNIRKRLFIYGSSKEKNNTLYDFETSDNGILVGPTLTEGIDLPDDGCRFIIIMKIPYPNLGDNLVLAKVKIFPRWYNSETSNTVIQAIGRGNRTPTDWCTTYILDGNFGQLYQETINQYPEELQKRMQVVNM